MHFQHFLEYVDSLSSVALILFPRSSRYVLLSISGGQIKPGIQLAGVVIDGLLEVRDRLFVLGAFISLHALVELVASLELAAAQACKHHQSHSRQRQHS